MPNPQNLANELMIELPSTISSAENTMICSYLPQRFSEDYFSLILAKNNNIIPCTFSGGALIIKSINTVISSLTVDDFLRIAIFKLKNADLSAIGHNFVATFIDSTTETVVESGTITNPYRISPTPTNIQFTGITVDSSYLFIVTKYTFTMSTINNENIHINTDSRMGIMIAFPTEYENIWDTISAPTKVKITLGSDVYEDVPEMISGLLLVRFKVTAVVEFTSMQVEFDFRNPETALNCEVLPVFKLSIIDFKLNSIRAETISNYVDCP